MMPDDIGHSDEDMDDSVSDQTLHAELGNRVEKMMTVIGEKAINNIKDAQIGQKRNYDQRHTNQQVNKIPKTSGIYYIHTIL